MKITKQGTKPFDRIWTGVCRQCGSEAEAAESELHNITSDFRDHERFSWEVCPVCGLGDGKTGYGGMLFHERMRQDQ